MSVSMCEADPLSYHQPLLRVHLVSVRVRVRVGIRVSVSVRVRVRVRVGG